MKKIAYICSQCTISDSPNRRSDAFEHDLTLDALRPEQEKRGLQLKEVCWDDSHANWADFELAIIGTTWDYWQRHDLFLQTLESIETKTRLCNSSAMVRWNSNKRYLIELAARGAKLIPTEWIQNPTKAAIENAFAVLGCDDMVVKRQIGAGADGQHRLKRGDVIPDLNRPMMAQPFFPSIKTEGEMSLIYIDGQFSHALIKRAVAGDYRIQSSYGGTEQPYDPSQKDLAMAKSVLDVLDEVPLYGRVDMLRGESGELYLMELELIEPYLYPVEGPGLGSQLAEAVKRRLS